MLAKKEWPAMLGVKRVAAEAHDYYDLDSFGLLDREQHWSLSLNTTNKWHRKFNNTSL